MEMPRLGAKVSLAEAGFVLVVLIAVPDRELEVRRKAVGLQALGIDSPFGNRKARDRAHIKRSARSEQELSEGGAALLACCYY